MLLALRFSFPNVIRSPVIACYSAFQDPKCTRCKHDLMIVLGLVVENTVVKPLGAHHNHFQGVRVSPAFVLSMKAAGLYIPM